MILKIGNNGPDALALQKALNRALAPQGRIIDEDSSIGPETVNDALYYAMLNLTPELLTVAPPTASAFNMPIPKNLSARTLGLDVYHDDDITSWQKLYDAGRVWAYIKATESTNYQDKAFQAYMEQAKIVGLRRGAYHFFHLDVDGEKQAQYFHNFVTSNCDLGPKDFIVLDWETKNGDPYSAKDPATGQAFLEACKELFKKRAFVYLGYSMANSMNNPSYLAEYPLILPWYTKESNLLIPKPWSRINIWQSSGTTVMPGLGNPGDSDTFYGDLTDLDAVIDYCNLKVT